MPPESRDRQPAIAPELKETERRFEEALDKAKSADDFNREIDAIQKSITEKYKESNPTLVQKVELAAQKAKEKVRDADINFNKRNDEARAAVLRDIRGIFIEGGNLEQTELGRKYTEIMRFVDSLPDPNFAPYSPEALDSYVKNFKQITDSIRSQHEKDKAPVTLLRAQIDQLYNLLYPRNKSPEAKSLYDMVESEKKAKEALTPYASEIVKTIERVIKNNKVEDRSYLNAQLEALIIELKKTDILKRGDWLFTTSIDNDPLAILGTRNNDGSISVSVLYAIDKAMGKNGELAEFSYNEKAKGSTDNFFRMARNGMPKNDTLARRT